MVSPLEKIQNKLSGKSDSGLLPIIDLIREFGCLGEIIGRDLEIKDATGKVIYSIHQKPITIAQLNILLKGLYELRVLEEKELKKSSKGRK